MPADSPICLRDDLTKAGSLALNPFHWDLHVQKLNSRVSEGALLNGECNNTSTTSALCYERQSNSKVLLLCMRSFLSRSTMLLHTKDSPSSSRTTIIASFGCRRVVVPKLKPLLLEVEVAFIWLLEKLCISIGPLPCNAGLCFSDSKLQLYQQPCFCTQHGEADRQCAPSCTGHQASENSLIFVSIASDGSPYCNMQCKSEGH